MNQIVMPTLEGHLINHFCHLVVHWKFAWKVKRLLTFLLCFNLRNRSGQMPNNNNFMICLL